MHPPLEWILLALLALLVVCGCEAKEYRKVGAEFVPAESGKRYNEPSCEQLRAMWRFSKRQARASEVTNEIPQYRDPFVYNVWEPYPGTLRSVGARTKTASGSAGGSARRQRLPVYGKIVHTPPPGSARSFDSPRTRAFDELTARMFGSPGRSGGSRKTLRYTGADGSLVPQAGSFQQLKDIVRAERARELQQRFTDDATMQNYGQMVVSLPPPGEDDGTYGSFRYGKQEDPARVRGVLSFPDVLAPAAGRLDEMSESGFTSPEEAFGPEVFAPLEEDLPPVRLSAKAAKQRSLVTKGQRVFKAAPRTKQGSAASADAASTYPFPPDTRAMSSERGIQLR
ncbi:uncharacterized protein LOC132193902 [Neocloeon triangulifer]|uniref:uncharacterized protein LOC132193902 n=1 Tax=Neocloeon triangulifer TaxID=2078957 RepID=UPI00286F82E8|nr:uncharacterized protein LOC132193902 [Neocloeon triangulifer]XP_059470835.1 uncharacterized protein LOC132193902 [Neocloeon triangulifer]